MTGYGVEQNFDKLRQLHCARIIVKPFTPSSMEEAIAQTLASYDNTVEGNQDVFSC
jgi:hypothetical protein